MHARFEVTSDLKFQCFNAGSTLDCGASSQIKALTSSQQVWNQVLRIEVDRSRLR